MQSVGVDEHAESDDESLFGSPPPSPGGTVTPLLALPGGGLNSEQNVGTLALPGLHNFSELAGSPIVVPSNDSCRSESTQSSSFVSQPQSASSHSTSRRPSIRRSSTTTRLTRKPKRSRENSAVPRAGPSIQLPCPDTPLPPNFLRNQQALLGFAGMVAGINPATLSLDRHTRGMNIQNPIVVEDEPDAPSIGRRCGQRVTSPSLSQLPAPSPDQVFETIVNQKNIFPVLEAIIKYIGSDPSHQFDSGSPQTPLLQESLPTKRRRMSQVPAGADGWDTPYPFPSGEGPPNYQRDWNKERGKQLISELVSLIRSASKKAATKSYVRQNDPGQNITKINRHYRPVTATYGNPSTFPPSHTPHELTPTPMTSLDRLVNSMVTLTQHQPSSNNPPIEIQGYDEFISLLSDVISEQDGSGPVSRLELPQSPSIPPYIPDSLIDPLLLGLSNAKLELGSNSANSIAGTSTPGLVGSPIPSCSSATDPATPNYDVTMFVEPDIASRDPGWEASGSGPGEGNWSRELKLRSSEKSSSASVTPSLTNVPANGNSNSHINSFSDQSMTPIALIRQQLDAQPFPSASQPRPSTKRTTATQASSKSVNAIKQRREHLIQKAKEMRRQLVGEIGKSKVELWEMTMEQGVLTHLSKDDSLS